MNRHWTAGWLGAAALALAGCQSMYYSTMEKFGVEKRDIMVSRVKSAQESQKDAKEQFKDALEQFGSVVKVKGGELQKKYDRLSAVCDRSEARAQTVRERIGAVEDVSRALFAEWKKEIGQYSSADLRRQSEQKLRETQRRYDGLIDAMRRAEGSMEPVLKVLRDQVLFLKHNLNARAIASLQDELAEVELNVGTLVKEMEAAIGEADSFIRNMQE